MQRRLCVYLTDPLSLLCVIGPMIHMGAAVGKILSQGLTSTKVHTIEYTTIGIVYIHDRLDYNTDT